MKQLIKKFSKWILSEELKQDDELIYRLRSYCRPHLTELRSNGEDQENEVQMFFDINEHLTLPYGIFKIGTCIKMPSKCRIVEDEK